MSDDFFFDEEPGNEEIGGIEYELPEAELTEPLKEEGKETPFYVYFLLGLVIGALPVYYYMAFDKAETIEEFNFEIDKTNNAYQSFNKMYQTCEATKYAEMIQRQKEINLTAMCWDKLTICHDQNYDIMGLNLTESKLKSERDKLLKEIQDTKKRLEKWEKTVRS